MHSKDIGEEKTIIRPATPSDIPFIQALSKEVFHAYGPYEAILTAWFESEATMTGLAVVDGKPAGFAMVKIPQEKVFEKRITELVAIAVEPEKQRCGIGDQLMEAVLEVAENLQVDTLILSTAVENVPAQKLFEKHGFSPWRIKKGYYEKGQNALIMYRILAAPF
jgi:ribosomal-protein-alanine N-acetyltransferase